ncbi:hypothetical protein [Desmospora profundinema]|uniref:Multisubunit Na+/H+ antiporter MnhB subunit n=1 Tax=Desmospora profundinema TaxID=1571184 RepID=A0ABU1IIY9_9BACL|nr:hypothetical protein [Desmospora profundinema]MDR6224373.1 multisubunit Na+/H+ antiporter MnhB subunit [Desmospora profundinema]
MWIIGLLAVVAFIVAYYLPKMLKQGDKREMVVFFSLLIVGTGLSIAVILEWRVPNPMDWITVMIQPFSQWLFEMLG